MAGEPPGAYPTAMARYYFRPIADKSVVSVLHYVRCVIVREEREGVEHVDALLRMYGVDPASLPIPRKVERHFGRSELRRAILAALRSGPLTGAEIAERVRGSLDYRACYKRTYIALAAMQADGVVGRAGRVWRLRA